METQTIILVVGFGFIGLGLLHWVTSIKPKVKAVTQNRKSPHARLVAAGIDVTKLDIPRDATTVEIEHMLQNGWKEHVQDRARKRVALENNTSYGEPIWLSFYADRGSLKHWAILIHRQKYELRRVRSTTPPDASEDVDRDPEIALNEKNEVHRERIDDVRNSSGFGRYYEKMIQDDPSYHQTMEAREAAIKAGRKPEAGPFCISHVGWTRKTREEVDAACLKVERAFGTYNFIFNNCQHFVQQLATEVVDRKSEDWDWFQRLSPTTYDYERPETIGSPGGVARLCIDKLKEAKAMLQTTDTQVFRQALRTFDLQIEVFDRYLSTLEPVWENLQKNKSLMAFLADDGGASDSSMLEGNSGDCAGGGDGGQAGGCNGGGDGSDASGCNGGGHGGDAGGCDGGGHGGHAGGCNGGGGGGQ